MWVQLSQRLCHKGTLIANIIPVFRCVQCLFLRLLHYYHRNFVPVGNACFSTARKFVISGIRVSGTDTLCLKFCIKWIFNDLCHSIGMSSAERYFMVLYSLCGMNYCATN
jgi:hypothetical protein